MYILYITRPHKHFALKSLSHLNEGHDDDDDDDDDDGTNISVASYATYYCIASTSPKMVGRGQGRAGGRGEQGADLLILCFLVIGFPHM